MHVQFFCYFFVIISYLKPHRGIFILFLYVITIERLLLDVGIFSKSLSENILLSSATSIRIYQIKLVYSIIFSCLLCKYEKQLYLLKTDVVIILNFGIPNTN